GAEPFYQLVLALSDSDIAPALDKIKGLSFRDDHGAVRHNEVSREFEFIDYREIPYHLIKDYSPYRYVDSSEIAFPIYSVMGCPYRCAFCSSPAQYAKMEKKWRPYKTEDILAHIRMLKEKFGATFIYFIDDDSFVDLKHVEAIIDAINGSGLKVKLGFRGARVNEVARMSGDFLRKLAEAGTDALHIGVESGSNRLLQLMKKDITAELSLEVNKKLSRFPGIRVFYNFIVGLPTETMEETRMTRDLILQLIRDNPSCCVLPLNKPRPLPGTELYDLALEHGYVPPASLEGWGKYDVESSGYNPEWLTKEHNRFIRMMFLCMYFIDDKIFVFSKGRSFKFLFLKVAAVLYKPLAMLRFRNGFYRFLAEDYLYRIIQRLS
ncbi:MAG TPA: radical SAM protein, partial [bacterium]|nr:radical SAM protein [bacterium]